MAREISAKNPAEDTILNYIIEYLLYQFKEKGLKINIDAVRKKPGQEFFDFMRIQNLEEKTTIITNLSRILQKFYSLAQQQITITTDVVITLLSNISRLYEIEAILNMYEKCEITIDNAETAIETITRGRYIKSIPMYINCVNIGLEWLKNQPALLTEKYKKLICDSHYNAVFIAKILLILYEANFLHTNQPKTEDDTIIKNLYILAEKDSDYVKKIYINLTTKNNHLLSFIDNGNFKYNLALVQYTISGSCSEKCEKAIKPLEIYLKEKYNTSLSIQIVLLICYSGEYADIAVMLLTTLMSRSLFKKNPEIIKNIPDAFLKRVKDDAEHVITYNECVVAAVSDEKDILQKLEYSDFLCDAISILERNPEFVLNRDKLNLLIQHEKKAPALAIIMLAFSNVNIDINRIFSEQTLDETNKTIEELAIFFINNEAVHRTHQNWPSTCELLCKNLEYVSNINQVIECLYNEKELGFIRDLNSSYKRLGIPFELINAVIAHAKYSKPILNALNFLILTKREFLNDPLIIQAICLSGLQAVTCAEFLLCLDKLEPGSLNKDNAIFSLPASQYLPGILAAFQSLGEKFSQPIFEEICKTPEKAILIAYKYKGEIEQKENIGSTEFNKIRSAAHFLFLFKSAANGPNSLALLPDEVIKKIVIYSGDENILDKESSKTAVALNID